MTEKENDKLARRYLLLFKLDVKNLYRRLSSRKEEYITIFAIKRSRQHFEQVFKSRFDVATFSEISHCDEDTIMALHQFYDHVENIRWYLDHTQDMPNMIEDELTRQFHKLDRDYQTVMLYIDAQLGVKSEFEVSADNQEISPAVENANFGENPWENTPSSEFPSDFSIEMSETTSDDSKENS